MLFILLILLSYGGLALANFQPIQIIKPSDDHRDLVLVEEKLHFLTQIDQPIAIIGVVGGYHSGKSFLLNSLNSIWTNSNNNSKLNLFEVAGKVSPQTMGIWLVDTNITLKDGSRVLFLDTEGFYGNDVPESYDAKIFTTATLLSSYLIYNSVKLIDQASVDYVEILSRRTQLFQLNNIIRNTELTDSSIQNLASQGKMLQYNDFPPLSWVVKDFAQDLDGMSPKQWLEQYLLGKRDQSNQTKGSSMNDLFTKGIECHTLFLPATERDKLRDLGQVEINKLTTEFMNDLSNLGDYVFNHLSPKTLDDQPINGEDLVLLVRFLMNYINQDQFPSIPSLRDTWMLELVNSAQLKMQNFYQERMSRIIQITPPLNFTEITEYHSRFQDQSNRFYREWLWNLKGLYQLGEAKLVRTLKKTFQNDILVQNSRLIEHYFEKLVNRYMMENADQISSMNLPINPLVIEEMKSQSFNQWINTFDQKFYKYNTDSLFAKNKKILLDSIEANYQYLDKQNIKYVQELLTHTATISTGKYSLEISSMIEYPRTKNELNEVKVKASNACQDAIEQYLTEKISPSSFEWISKMKIYTEYQNEVDSTKNEIFGRLINKNQELVENFLKSKVNFLVAETQSEMFKIFPFPDLTEIVDQKSITITNTCIQKFIDEVGNFSDYNSYTNELKKLKSEMNEMIKITDDRNIASVTSQSFYALKKAKTELYNTSCTVCLENMFTFTYRQKAIKIAEKYLSVDERAKFFPKALRLRAIEKWIETDLNSEMIKVYGRMLLILITVIILIIFGLIIECSKHIQNLPTKTCQECKRSYPSSDNTWKRCNMCLKYWVCSSCDPLRTFWQMHQQVCHGP